MLVAAKIDVANPDKLKKLSTMAKRKKLPLYMISAVTGEGIPQLKYALGDAVALHRHIPLEEPTKEPAITKPVRRKPLYPPPAPNAKGRSK